VIAGDGPLRALLEHQGARLPNIPTIMSLSEEELIRFYNMADLYVHASEVETEGIAMLEAMACGAPLLVAKSPLSAASHFGLDDSSYFAFADHLELALKIDNFICHPEALYAAKQRSLEVARQFTLDGSVDLLEALYLRHASSRTVPHSKVRE
jgi:1,2-diacylglycerol 3-alpha-glucosyltransferase